MRGNKDNVIISSSVMGNRFQNSGTWNLVAECTLGVMMGGNSSIDWV